MPTLIDYERLLREHGLWPVDEWDRLAVTHSALYVPQEEAGQLEAFRREVGGTGGLYVYRNAEEWLYSGKGKSLFERFKAHYQSASRALSGEKSGQRWHRFWHPRAGEPMTLYWTAVEDEDDRVIFEAALTKALRPLYWRIHHGRP